MAPPAVPSVESIPLAPVDESVPGWFSDEPVDGDALLVEFAPELSALADAAASLPEFAVELVAPPPGVFAGARAVADGFSEPVGLAVSGLQGFSGDGA